MTNKMLKGSGDFTPADPVECPDDCEYYTPDRGRDDYCQHPHGCKFDPPHPDDIGDRKYHNQF